MPEILTFVRKRLFFQVVTKVKCCVTQAKVYNGTTEGKGKGVAEEARPDTGRHGTRDTC